MNFPEIHSQLTDSREAPKWVSDENTKTWELLKLTNQPDFWAENAALGDEIHGDGPAPEVRFDWSCNASPRAAAVVTMDLYRRLHKGGASAPKHGRCMHRATVRPAMEVELRHRRRSTRRAKEPSLVEQIQGSAAFDRFGAGGGGRTHMPSEGRGILSPVRLPVPPLRPIARKPLLV